MKILLVFLLIIATFTSNAQNKLQTPIINYVTVDLQTGRPTICWQIDNPESVDGFIVKRLIVDGSGVVSNTYNNIAVIENNKVFSYTDNSTDYSTYANPSQRVEYYRVSSYVIIDGQRYYSLMSNPQSTMLLNVDYNICENEYNFLWNSDLSSNVDYYVLHSSEESFSVDPKFAIVKDTTLTFKFDKFRSLRRFTVECVLKNGFSEFSPIVELQAEQQIPPETICISNISVDENNNLNLTLNASESKFVSKYVLIRNDENQQSDTIFLDFLEAKNYVYVDTTANVSKHYIYLLTALNNCGEVFALSNSASNIVLNVDAVENGNINNLDWNMLTFWQQDSYNVDIWRSIDDNSFEPIYSAASHELNYSDILSNIIADREEHSGKFCYQLCFTYTNGEISFSNVGCVNRQAVIFLPNALNPNSLNSENWTFRPKADFLDGYKLTIYNKRGAIIYESEHLSEGWDGRDSSGKLYPMDSYVYLIVYKDSDGKNHKLSGFVNLVY